MQRRLDELNDMMRIMLSSPWKVMFALLLFGLQSLSRVSALQRLISHPQQF